MSIEEMVQGRVDGVQGLDPLVQVGLEWSGVEWSRVDVGVVVNEGMCIVRSRVRLHCVVWVKYA